MVNVLQDSHIQQALNDLPGWEWHDGHLCRDYHFNDFKQALSWIVQIGLVAETLNHHPVIINVYNKVSLKLRTHQPDGITSLDIDLAKAIDLQTNPV
jgi:4a-hydroxytetrahydrobiopterin dehydratase